MINYLQNMYSILYDTVHIIIVRNSIFIYFFLHSKVKAGFAVCVTL